MDAAWAHASEIAAAVSDGRTGATAVVRAALARIAKHDRALNAFTAVTEERALAKAAAVDAERAKGRRLGALAGVPFAVKNLFDIAGLPTLAGSKINRDHAPAARDATLIARLETNGAVLVGALNMGEYAYDFTGENVHYGASRNPHDVSRMTGVVVRDFRSEADLRPAFARPHVSLRGKPRSCRTVGAQHARSRARL
jgi:Asp-tRNA(Asn)/Glu-tRNA(Gln) amidotransferase A subunit family amidase